MRILESFDEVGELNHSVVTTGTYDGVHFGHQKILRDVSEQAKAHNGESVVITYWPHPRFVLGKDGKNLRLLTTFDEKAELIQSCGIDILMKVPFTRAFSQLSADEYIQKVLVKGAQTKKLIIGYDHKFGKNQEGSFDYLQRHQKAFGFEIQEIHRQDIEHIGVSSTRIRNALMSGDISTANEYLGRPYTISGLVTKGEQIGRKMGFPTANVYVPEDYKLIPSDGVYVVRARVGGMELDGMLNIGHRPTVSGLNKTIEVNLFNFEQDIYGLGIEITFLDYVREEKKFENIDQLKSQLVRDKEQSILILKNHTNEKN